ncbi:MAG: tRNA (adenosine(37)-N6)-threonylcarbamoyltransferase complex transferase subunit TsaD, partial [Catalinimonas sp.]
GPGLLGALLVGASFAKGLALALGVPLLPVHHMRAHILAHFIEPPVPPFPFLCLTVSGGHTQLVRVDAPTRMHLLGQTRDDAVGEAFDKIGKLLGLPYPGGPLLDRHAQRGNPHAFDFPLTEVPDLDFSFSGIKTGVLYFLRREQQRDPDFATRHRDDLCASVQRALVEMLMVKVRRAVEATGLRHVALAGGVAANSALREALRAQEAAGWHTYIPAFEYCTDNAAMIAQAAHFQWEAGLRAGQEVSPVARWPLTTS